MCCVCCVAGALMHELEAILHEYLSFNWDRMEEVNTANAPLQRKEGLACPWRPSKDIEHSVSPWPHLLGRTCNLHNNLKFMLMWIRMWMWLLDPC